MRKYTISYKTEFIETTLLYIIMRKYTISYKTEFIETTILYIIMRKYIYIYIYIYVLKCVDVQIHNFSLKI